MKNNQTKLYGLLKQAKSGNRYLIYCGQNLDKVRQHRDTMIFLNIIDYRTNKKLKLDDLELDSYYEFSGENVVVNDTNIGSKSVVMFKCQGFRLLENTEGLLPF